MSTSDYAKQLRKYLPVLARIRLLGRVLLSLSCSPEPGRQLIGRIRWPRMQMPTGSPSLPAVSTQAGSVRRPRSGIHGSVWVGKTAEERIFNPPNTAFADLERAPMRRCGRSRRQGKSRRKRLPMKRLRLKPSLRQSYLPRRQVTADQKIPLRRIDQSVITDIHF